MWNIFKILQKSSDEPFQAKLDLPGMVFQHLSSMADAFILCDLQGMILYCNQSAMNIHPLIQKDHSVFTAFRSPVLKEICEELQETGNQRLNTEITMRTPTEAVYDVNVTFHQDSFLIYLQDITIQKQTLKMHGDFVANVSHELRTPLASICGFIETLQTYAKDDPAATEQFLDIMAAQAKRMNHLINSLLSLSRIELDQHILPKTTCDLTDIVKNVALAMSPLGQEKQIQITTETFDSPAMIRGCPEQVFQIFQNLVENALKYSPENTVITLKQQQEDSFFAVSIIDQGYGIDSAHIPRLTERFYRVDDARHRSQGGAGLGLSIVGKIIERHHGRLEINSVVGQGSCFKVLFPKI